MSMALVTVTGTLWCGSGNQIHVLDYKKETVMVKLNLVPRPCVCPGQYRETRDSWVTAFFEAIDWFQRNNEQTGNEPKEILLLDKFLT